MSKIQIVQLEPAHVDNIDLREHEAEVLDRNAWQSMAARHSGWAMLCDDKIIAIFGIAQMWNGVAEVGVVPSKWLCLCAFRYIRTARRYVDAWMKSGCLHRIQSASKADEQTDKWMRVLGFTCEGTLKAYSPGKHDYRMWARYAL